MSVPVIEEQVLKVYEDKSGRVRGQGRGWFCGRGRGSSSFKKSIMEYYHCHNLGHYQYECPSKQKETNFAKAQEEMRLMAYMENDQAKKEDEWFLDSGCSNHMYGKNELFSELDENFRETVKLGSNSSMVVIRKRNVRF